MKTVKFVLEDAQDSTGCTVPTLFKLGLEDGKEVSREPWGDVQDFDTLYKACSRRWGDGNWDLDLVCVAIRESDVEPRR
jgi:hypothetical protein